MGMDGGDVIVIEVVRQLFNQAKAATKVPVLRSMGVGPAGQSKFLQEHHHLHHHHHSEPPPTGTL